jgi:hypothetical protein
LRGQAEVAWKIAKQRGERILVFDTATRERSGFRFRRGQFRFRSRDVQF